MGWSTSPPPHQRAFPHYWWRRFFGQIFLCGLGWVAGRPSGVNVLSGPARPFGVPCWRWSFGYFCFTKQRMDFFIPQNYPQKLGPQTSPPWGGNPCTCPWLGYRYLPQSLKEKLMPIQGREADRGTDIGCYVHSFQFMLILLSSDTNQSTSPYLGHVILQFHFTMLACYAVLS